MKREIGFFVVVLAGAALYAWIFWHESLGINALLSAVFILAAMGKLHPGIFKENMARWSAVGLLFSSLMVIVNNSLIAKGLHVATLALCIGVAQAPLLRFVWFSGLLALHGVIKAPLAMVFELFRGRKNKLQWRTLRNLILITVIPTFAVLFFFWLYYFSNSAFAALADKVLKSVEYWPIWQWPLGRLLLALLGASIVYAIGRENPLADKLEAFEANQCQELERKRKKVWWGHSTMALKQTYKISFFTLIALNLLLLVVNLTDVATVWWGIVPETPYELSQFVHTGTYLLIFSILVASFFVVVIFWDNLNFFPHNGPLKTAAMIWLAQNVLLALSVGARNYHYIAGYGLAYKRIGVLVFLLLTIIGLITLYLKVRDRKSMYYLLITNTWAWFIVWMMCTTLNWDVLITRYNLRYTREALDLPYLINDLSDKNLYVLYQEHALIPANSYEAQQLDNKRKHFEQRLASNTWLSWNWADEVNRRGAE